MKKLVIGNYSAMDPKATPGSSKAYIDAMRMGPLLATELYGLERRILSVDEPDAIGFAEVLNRYIGAERVEVTSGLRTDEHRLKRNDMDYYDEEMKRLNEMIDCLETQPSTGGLVLVTPRAITDLLPSYVARGREFPKGVFFPGQAMVLDMDKKMADLIYATYDLPGQDLSL